MKVDLYARVSTEDQNVEQQIILLRKWAKKEGHTITSDIIDKESGTIPLQERKQFKSLLYNPKGEALVILDLNRLSRNWYDQNFLEKHFLDNDYKLICLYDQIDLDTPNGRLMFRIKFAINCQYVEDMKSKQAIGIARAKAQGKYKGRPKGAKGKK
jgi:putative DNA-invertase from lambdoid prophage Rac